MRLIVVLHAKHMLLCFFHPFLPLRADFATAGTTTAQNLFLRAQSIWAAKTSYSNIAYKYIVLRDGKQKTKRAAIKEGTNEGPICKRKGRHNSAINSISTQRTRSYSRTYSIEYQPQWRTNYCPSTEQAKPDECDPSTTPANFAEGAHLDLVAWVVQGHLRVPLVGSLE